MKHKLKFRDPLTWEAEKKLCQKFGFSIHARKIGEYLIVERYSVKGAGRKPPMEVLINGHLPHTVTAELNRRIKNICDMFADPDAHCYVIGTRLNNIRATLPPLQAKYVLDWMKENLDDFPLENEDD